MTSNGKSLYSSEFESWFINHTDLDKKVPVEVPSRVPADLFPYILVASVTSIYQTCLIAVNDLCRLERFTLNNTKFV